MIIPFDKAFAMLEQGKTLVVEVEGPNYVKVQGIIQPEVTKNIYYTPVYKTKVVEVVKCGWLTKGETLTLKIMRGGVFHNVRDLTFYSDAILKDLPKIEKLRKNKKPTNKRANYVGVELEMCTKLSDAELTTLLIKHKLDRYCTIAGDGSIDTTDDHPLDLELKILAKESEIEKVITKVCKILNTDNRADVNDSCGLHVHLDMRNRNVEETFKKLYDVQDKMEDYVDSSRLENDYCQRNTVPRFTYYAEGSSRYYTINATAYKKFKTLEVRLHDGTLNSNRINKWIKFLLTTVKQKSKVSKTSKQKVA